MTDENNLGKKYVQGGYNDETVEFGTVPEQDTPRVAHNNIDDPEIINRIATMKLENLPGDDRDGDYWVSSYRYQEIYDDYLGAEENLAILNRNYARAFEQNKMLRAENNQLSTQITELSGEDRAARSFNDEMTAQLEADSKKLEEEKKRFQPIKIALFVITGIAVLASIVFLSLWLQTRTEGVSANQRDAAQQEQVRNLRSSLEEERSNHAKTKAELDKAHTQSDGLSQESKDRAAEVDKLKRDVEGRDKDIEKLNNDMNALKAENQRLNSRTPETVTKTFVQQQEGSSSTVTATTTVTVPPSTTN